MGPQLGGYLNMEAACSLEFRSKLYGPQALPNCHGAQVVHCEVVPHNYRCTLQHVPNMFSVHLAPIGNFRNMLNGGLLVPLEK